MKKYILFLIALAEVSLAFNTQVHGKGGIFFIQNTGQWPAEVRFKTSVPGGDLYILKNKLKYVFYDTPHQGHEGITSTGSALRQAGQHHQPNDINAVMVSFEGANQGSSFVADGRLPTRISYIKGVSGRASHLAGAFSEVTLNDLYPGINLRIYGTGDAMKYDLIVSPGADPSWIIMRYQGQKALKIHEGVLQVETQRGAFAEQAPISYTGTAHDKKPVSSAFRLTGNKVTFQFPHGYDSSTNLIIDPELIFSTYSGSYADNWGFTATYDNDGNLYSGGIVFDVGFPTTSGVFQPAHAGEWDVGILKYDPTGKNLLWATYLGGSFSDVPISLIVNSKNQLIIYGVTSSPDFPVAQQAPQPDFMGGDAIYDTTFQQPYRLVGGISMLNGTDQYVAMLSADGSLLEGATYLGGSENDGIMEKYLPLTKNYGDQFRGEVNLDQDDNIYIVSNTSSADYPVKGGVQSSYGGGANDGVLAKYNADLTALLWCTYLGGAGMDALYAVNVDKQGNVLAAGGTDSNDFPMAGNTLRQTKQQATDVDGVVVKISATGDTLLTATYLGTTSYDQVYFMDLDASGHIYLLGQTQGSYPVSAGVYANANSGQFIHAIGPDMDTTYFSTVVGSGSHSPDISPTAFLVNECGNIFISGWGGILNHPAYGYIGGSTLGLPVTDNAFQHDTDGGDFYLMVLLEGARKLLYATYFGEMQGVGEHVDGGTSRFDKRGIVYQAVCGGCGGSSSFPTYPPDVWSTTNNSNNCNNAAFKFDLATLLARFDTDTEDFTQRGIREGCYPLTLVFLNESIGGEDFEWNFGEGTVTNQKDSITIRYDTPGNYPVVLTATDINTCQRVSQATGMITVHDYDFSIMQDDSICYGDDVTLWADGGVIYDWNPKNSLKNASTSMPEAFPDSTTLYVVQMEDGNGCTAKDSLTITVVPAITADFSYVKEYDCHAPPNIVFNNTSLNASHFTWDFGDGQASEETSPSHKYQATDSLKSYNVVLTAGQSFCAESMATKISSVKPFVPNFISPNDDGKNDAFQITADGAILLHVYNRWGRQVYSSPDYHNDWHPDNLSSGVYFYEIIFEDKNTGCNGWLHVMH